jgi:hypothetical protein
LPMCSQLQIYCPLSLLSNRGCQDQINLSYFNNLILVTRKPSQSTQLFFLMLFWSMMLLYHIYRSYLDPWDIGMPKVTHS